MAVQAGILAGAVTRAASRNADDCLGEIKGAKSTEHASAKSTGRLSKEMTAAEFDNGYWYATDPKPLGRGQCAPGTGRLRRQSRNVLWNGPGSC
jgi:hypothetical protein